MKKLLTLLALLMCSGYSILTAQSKNSVLTPETMLSIPRIAEPRISPDGKWVAFTRREINLLENKSQSYVCIIPAEGGEIKRVSRDVDNAHSIQWIGPERLAFVSSETGEDHLLEMNIDGTGRNYLTHGPKGIGAFGYTQSADRVWISSQWKMDKKPSETYRDLPHTSKAKIIDGLMYRHWTSWHDGTYSHVYTAKIENGTMLEAVDVLAGQRYDTPLKPFGGAEQLAFSPDGLFLAYTCKKASGTAAAISTNSDIYIFDATTFRSRNLTEDNPGYDINPVYSADGRRLYWLSMATPGYEADKSRLMRLDLVTGEKRDLTADFKYSVESFALSPGKEEKVYVLAGAEGVHNFFTIDLIGNTRPRITQLTKDEADYQDFTVGMVKGKETLIATRMSISDPTEIYAIDAAGGKATRLTKETAAVWDGIKKGKVEKRLINTSDGKPMLTWVIYPPDFDPKKKYPTLLYCQGGPQSTVSQFFSYRWNFQLMAANGYIIVAPNRRGLPSFGAKWNEQISGDWGGQAMQDLLSAIDDVKKESYVDAERLGAVGASFGGYSVYWLAGNHNKRFKAFISHCGVFNLESMYGTTEELFFVNHDLGGPYWQTPTPRSYVRDSPHRYVANWDTPILVIHNELDFRVPVSQGMEAFTAAQLREIPSRFLYFPDEGHWVNKPQNSVLWNRVFFDWLNTYLKK